MQAVDARLKPESQAQPSGARAAALVWTAHAGAEVTVRSLAHRHPEVEITVAPNALSVAGVSGHIGDGDLGVVMREMAAAHPSQHLVVILEPVVVPEGFLDRALDALDADLRLSSVSFLCNDAGYLSFPFRNT